MKLGPITKNDSIKRLNEIYMVLKKNDFGYLIEENTFLSDFPFLRNKEEEDIFVDSENPIPVRVRKIFEDLGSAYIKLGQMLATRPDLIGLDIAKELEKLNDDAPKTPFDEILRIIEEELGEDPMNIFSFIDENPLGSASIGQVHKGILKETGEEVAIKVQKPNTYEIIQADVKIMKFLAKRIDKFLHSAKVLNTSLIIQEFERSIFKELDYIEEVINMQHLDNNFKNDSSIHIPKVYSNYCTTKLIVMELIKGTEMAKVIESDDSKFDKKAIAKVGVNAYFKQVILDGFFHADPHPGNIFIMENNVVCFIDMGMMGILTDEFRRNLAQLLITLNGGNVDHILKQLSYMGILTTKQITPELKDEVNDLLFRYYGTELSNDSGVFEKLIQTMIKHNVKIPKEFINIGRGIALIEKSGVALDPSFNPEVELKKLSKKIVYQHYGPKNMMKEFINYAIGFQHLIKDLPDRINSTLYKIEEGEISVKLQHEGIDRAVNKLSYSLIISSLIIGSSLAILADKGPKILDISIIGFIGFILSACFSLIVVLRIMREKY